VYVKIFIGGHVWKELSCPTWWWELIVKVEAFCCGYFSTRILFNVLLGGLFRGTVTVKGFILYICLLLIDIVTWGLWACPTKVHYIASRSCWYLRRTSLLCLRPLIKHKLTRVKLYLSTNPNHVFSQSRGHSLCTSDGKKDTDTSLPLKPNTGLCRHVLKILQI